MSLAGKVVSGSFDVMIGGEKAARKSDLIDHGGLITGGCATVVVNGTALIAARVGDPFSCPSALDGPHVGGVIVGPGCMSVVIGGGFAARVGESTVCLGPGEDGGGGDGGDGAAADDADAACVALWAQYEKEARDRIAPGEGNHRTRNRLISAAYAEMALANPELRWAGLAAYASKQVGCAMDIAKDAGNDAVKRSAPLAPVAGPLQPLVPAAVGGGGLYMYAMLGHGNRELFLDVYPLHRFYQEHGFARMSQCAGERTPPVPAQALDSFRALDLYKATGDKKYLDQHVASLAWHEQVNLLQRDVYNDAGVRKLLLANQVDQLPFTVPATVVMTSGCKDPTNGALTHTFGDKDRWYLYDVGERMDWILNDVAKDYAGFAGGERHKRDLEDIKRQGEIAHPEDM